MTRTIPDWQVALGAQAEILGLVASERGQRYMAGWVRHRDQAYGLHAASPSAVACSNAVEDMLAVEPLFVTEEMLDLTYHAMETFDASESLHYDDLFLPSGFAYLEQPFYIRDIKGKRLCWRAVSWRYAETPVFPVDEREEMTQEEYVARLKDAAENNVQPALRMILWAHVDDPDDYPYSPEEMARLGEEGIRWGISHATTIPFQFFKDGPQIENDGDPGGTWMVFFRVMQRLLAQRVVVKAKRDVHRARWREAARKGLDLRSVIVVELRRPSTDSREPSGEPGNYSHRWIVHGGWQWRAYGPGHSLRRQVWIGNYVKGPEDKPLIVKDRVWTWNR